MISTRVIRVGLWATAGLNLGAGVFSVLLPSLHARLMLAGEVRMEGLLLRYHVLLWLFVALLGVGYAIAARAPERQTGLLVAGGLGKLAAAAVWIEMLASGYGAPLMLGGIAWDGALGVLLLVYALGLWRQRRAVSAPAVLPK